MKKTWWAHLVKREEGAQFPDDLWRELDSKSKSGAIKAARTLATKERCQYYGVALLNSEKTVEATL